MNITSVILAALSKAPPANKNKTSGIAPPANSTVCQNQALYTFKRCIQASIMRRRTEGYTFIHDTFTTS